MATTPAVGPLAASDQARSGRRRAWRRGWVALGGGLAAIVVTLWVVMHRVAWLAPSLADTGRKVLGDRAVATLEDWAYAADDAWNQFFRARERPASQWGVPPSAPAPAEPRTAEVAPDASRAFRPADVGPVYTAFAAPGDGAWVAVLDERHPESTPLMYKTLLHPDARRAWSKLYVVAIDRSRVGVRLVAGTVDPEATTPEGKAFHRTGLIPPADLDPLVAAFNGGFKTEHGHFGMRVEGVTLIAPRDGVCTVAAFVDDSLRIGPWGALAAEETRMTWWRQTPPCMVERGVTNPDLAVTTTTRWGASVGGDTVIRRSALGLSEGADILYMGVSEATTAGTLALGMKHAGAWDVAQLDVNWSYPKFLVFRPGASSFVEAVGLFPGFAFDPAEYLRRPAPKDFFYVVRR